MMSGGMWISKNCQNYASNFRKKLQASDYYELDKKGWSQGFNGWFVYRKMVLEEKRGALPHLKYAQEKLQF